MRLPKFRLKNKKNNWVHFSVFHNGVSTENFNEKTLGEFTGLLDRHGVEIYEGDIVTMKSYNHSFQNKYKYEVYYSETEARFKFRNNIVFPNKVDSDNTTRHSFEVIGNIHENPELIDN